MGKGFALDRKFVVVVFVLLMGTLAVTQALRGLEEQLAGVRLGASFIDYDEQGQLKPTCLLKIYGMPDYIVGRGTGAPQPGMSGAPMMPGGPMMPGAPPMMPGGPGAMGSGFGGQPTLPGVMAGVAGMSQLAGTPVGRPPMPSLPGGPMMPGAPMAPGGMEEMGALPGVGPMMGGMAGSAAAVPTYPRPEELPWAIPPFVQVEQNEIYFVYRRQGAHLNFLMELREERGNNVMRVVAITVAGRRYDGARTAKGDPFKSVKLGDDLQRVLLRYGQPDEIVYYNPYTLQVLTTPSRNMILRYHRSSNVEFTLLDNKVVRIFIFLPGRVTLTR